jgi:hypothetical protein
MSQPTRAVTLDVPEDLYRHFEDGARRTNRTTAELMREALASYELPYERRRGSVRRLQPLDLGEVLRPLTPDDDLLEEMLDA